MGRPFHRDVLVTSASPNPSWPVNEDVDDEDDALEDENDEEVGDEKTSAVISICCSVNRVIWRTSIMIFGFATSNIVCYACNFYQLKVLEAAYIHKHKPDLCVPKEYCHNTHTLSLAP
eukprot:scpid96913/ scgid30311/ 